MESLMAMGFPEHMCSKAMRMTGGDVEAAANYIMGAPARPPARPPALLRAAAACAQRLVLLAAPPAPLS
jgi:uncharacterized UBP type Zn finger protein